MAHLISALRGVRREQRKSTGKKVILMLRLFRSVLYWKLSRRCVKMNDKLGLAIVGGVSLVAVMVELALFGAFTISTLWGWFIVPLGVKSIGLAHAYGIGVLVTIFQGARGLSNTNTTNTLVTGIILNIIALLFGGIAVQFM